MVDYNITSLSKLNFKTKSIMIFTMSIFISLILFFNFDKKTFFIFSFISFFYTLMFYSQFYKNYEIEIRVYNDLENLKDIIRRIK